MNRTWSDWRALDSAAGVKGPATYRIRLATASNAVAIPRFWREDADGLLAIGKATNIESRRRRMARGAAKGRGHSEMNLLAIVQRQIALPRFLAEATYQYSFALQRSVSDAEALEQLLIKRYLLTFGEVPPLNSAIPGRYLDDGWEAARRDIDAGAF